MLFSLTCDISLLCSVQRSVFVQPVLTHYTSSKICPLLLFVTQNKQWMVSRSAVTVLSNRYALWLLRDRSQFLGAFRKSLNATFNFVMSVCLSVGMEKVDLYWKDFHEI